MWYTPLVSFDYGGYYQHACYGWRDFNGMTVRVYRSTSGENGTYGISWACFGY